jgi:hypothetical protein
MVCSASSVVAYDVTFRVDAGRIDPPLCHPNLVVRYFCAEAID